MATDDCIPDSHVPLSFLLGSAPRRLSSLAPRSRLPALSPRRSKRSDSLLLLAENATLREREALARSLLQELHQRSPSDRHERRREMQALLKTEEPPETPPLLRRRPSSAASLGAAHDDEDVYALPEYHGYAVTDPGFLSVAGDAAPIARASSLEELHQQEVIRQRRRHHARQRSVELAAAQLRAQQAATKAALRELTKRGIPVTAERQASQETSSNSTATLTWKERQRKEMERARERDAEEQMQRRQRVEQLKAQEQRTSFSQRQQQQQQPSRRQRPSAGPSYASTLRTDQDSASQSVLNDVLRLELKSEDACERDIERLPPNRLRARQREVFVQSLTSVHLGGGFNVQVQERPRSGGREPAEERERMVAPAVAVPVVQTKRQALSQWKAALRHATA